MRPLAEALSRLGLRIRFDELSLSAGDSLSREIDRGLGASRFGVVVLSHSFFSKQWSEYELRGLITREIDGKALILPVWHGVSREQVASFSAPLADKYATVATGQSPLLVAVQLLKAIDPERHKALFRWLLWQRLRRDSPTELAKLADLKPSPIRHAVLPAALLYRILLIDAALGDVAGLSLERAIENFQRDLNPAEEVGNWEHLAAAFVYARADKRLESTAPKEIFRHLLGITVSGADAAIQSLEADPDGSFEGDRRRVCRCRPVARRKTCWAQD